MYTPLLSNKVVKKMSELLSARVPITFKNIVMALAKAHGMDLSTFIRTCLQEKIDAESQISLPETIIERIGFLKQIVFNCYDWTRDEDLVKKEVEELWEMVQLRKNLP